MAPTACAGAVQQGEGGGGGSYERLGDDRVCDYSEVQFFHVTLE